MATKKKQTNKDSVSFLWKGYKWTSKVSYKDDSANYDDAYFGPAYYIDKDTDDLHLYIDYAKREFKEGEKTLLKSYMCGEIKGSVGHSYGTYVWKVQMPKQKLIWPAIWLCGAITWPPEVDVFEGYYDKNGKETIETNVHYGTKVMHQAAGAKRIPFWKILHKKTDTWKLVWKPDCIKIYLNGIRVRCIRNEYMLKYFNTDHNMYPIMNMMIRKGYLHSTTIPKEATHQHLIIKDFKYEKS